MYAGFGRVWDTVPVRGKRNAPSAVIQVRGAANTAALPCSEA